MKKILYVAFILGLGWVSACSNRTNTTEKVYVKKSDIVKKCIGVEGMTCVGCEVTLEDKVKGIKGVVSVKASSSDDEATIEFDTTKTDFLSITRAIKEAGYKTTTLREK